MNLTVNTDASFNQRHQCGTYAFTIVSNLGRHQASGPLKGNIHDATEAEMKCIVNALAFIAKDPMVMLKVTKIFINTDSMNAIHLFTRNERNIRRYRLDKKYYKRVAHAYLKIRESMPDKTVDISHVKGHNYDGSKRSYVNEWLDAMAKSEMNKLLKQKEDAINRRRKEDAA